MFEIVRMPKDEGNVKLMLDEFGDYIAAMYSEGEQTVHGDFNFGLEHFLFLWDSGGVFLLVRRDKSNEIISLAMCSQYIDMWTARNRVEVQRVVIKDTQDEATERQAIIDYLKGVASLLKFTQLYYNTHYIDGSILRELVWNDKE